MQVVTTSTAIHSHMHLWLTNTQFARTELIKNSLNPRFSRAIQMDYRFEEVQQLQFSVYDIDNESSTLDDDDFLGCLKCTLGEVGGTNRVGLI